MASERIDTIDYQSIISDLEAKKAALEASIASLKAAQSHGALGRAIEGAELPPVLNGASSGVASGQAFDLPQGALLGKTIKQAITFYLSAVRKKQTNKQIADALREHGVESAGSLEGSLETSVTGALNRMKGTEVLRFPDGWALAEWYPDSFKSRIADPDTKKGTGRRKKRKKAARRDSGHSATETVVAEGQSEGPQERILTLLRSKRGADLPGQEIIETLGIKPAVGNLVLGRLSYRKLVDRLENGNYRIAPSHANGAAAH